MGHGRLSIELTLLLMASIILYGRGMNCLLCTNVVWTFNGEKVSVWDQCIIDHVSRTN